MILYYNYYYKKQNNENNPGHTTQRSKIKPNKISFYEI